MHAANLASAEPLANKIPQACARLGIGKTALYELLKAGKLRSFKVGACTLIPEAELRRFIAERLAEAA
jgi:excisionase family DNA binding protein